MSAKISKSTCNGLVILIQLHERSSLKISWYRISQWFVCFSCISTTTMNHYHYNEINHYFTNQSIAERSCRCLPCWKRMGSRILRRTSFVLFCKERKQQQQKPHVPPRINLLIVSKSVYLQLLNWMSFVIIKKYHI